MSGMLKFLARLLLAVAACGPVRATGSVDWVEFPALKPFEGRPVRIAAVQFKPEGTGPFPAVVMLHGCGGMLTGSGNLSASFRLWGELMSRNGYVALLPDSLNPRGQRSLCAQQKRTILESREREIGRAHV